MAQEHKDNKGNGMTSSSLMFIEFENNKVPQFKEVRGKEWINYGEDNDYPDYLIELFLRSAKHNSIVNGKVNYITGKGWGYGSKINTVEDVAKHNQFISYTNKDGQSLTDLTRLAAIDYEIFNGFAYQLIWNNGKSDFEIYHVPFNRIRTNSDESIYFYSENWLDRDPKDEKWNYKEYPSFDPKVKKGSQLYVYVNKMPRKSGEYNVYPIPEYIGGVPVIETDIEIANFHLNNIRTGFSAGTILNFYDGRPIDEEAKKIEKKVKEKFQGTDRAGSVMLNFANGKDRGAEVVHLQPSEMDKQFIELEKRVQQETFTCHKVTSPMLFGVKTEGQLGGRSEMMEAYELFQNTYVTQRQMALEKVINEFAALKGLSKGYYIRQTEPIGFVFSEQTIKEVLPAKALAEMVANKFGIDLAKYEDKGVVVSEEKAVVKKFSTQEDGLLLNLFKARGLPRSKFSIIHSKGVAFTTFAEMEADFYKAAFVGEVKTKPIDRAVIDILNKDPLTDAKSIAEAIGRSVEDVEKAIKKLISKGLIKADSEDDVVANIPTEKGIDVIKSNLPKTTDIELRYSYEWRKGFTDSDLKNSREFCKELMQLDRLYSRREIEEISGEVGYNVWEHRGGFYRVPNTDKTLPYCRHTWVQHAVIINE